MNRKSFYLALSSLFLDHEFIMKSQQNSGKNERKQRKLRSGILLSASANLKADGVHLHTQHPETLYSTGQLI